ncbi:MAG: hypothetical protein HY317_00195 [Acidobacteria bacterium]|nr:hypothetical protein [Acidobacteriota bacterium]
MRAVLVRPGTLAGAFLLVALAGGASLPAAPDLPPALEAAPRVKDPVFALLLGLLDSDSFGTLTRERLEGELVRVRARTRLPYRRLIELRREAGEAGSPARVRAVFDGALDEPVPYSILGYRPGSVLATPACVFHEWTLGDVRVPLSRRVAGRSEVTLVPLEDVHVLLLAEGALRIDFAGWLDFLLGASLDDTEVSAVLVFRTGGRWIGLALGYNDEGAPRSGAFDFAADKILFPYPAEMRAVAHHMRGRFEAIRGGMATIRSAP